MYQLKEPQEGFPRKICPKNLIRKKEKSDKLIIRKISKSSCEVDYQIFYYSIQKETAGKFSKAIKKCLLKNCC